MSTMDYMMDVVARFRMVLDAHDIHMQLFDLHAIQVEAWLKGELLPFFEAEKTNGKLHDYWLECTPESKTDPGRKKSTTSWNYSTVLSWQRFGLS